MKKKRNKSKFAIKLLMCLVYIGIAYILFKCSYAMFQEKNKIIPWSEVEKTEDYSYITINKMSEKFAYFKEDNIGIHFVIENEEDGQWHTYLIAIDENTYDDYKQIIDYSYERTDIKPDPIKVYGYPRITSPELRNMAIKNITNFLPAENEVVITEENYEAYLTNSYLDTTRERVEKFNIMLFILLLLMFMVIALLITTILGRDRIVDKVDKHLDEEIDRARVMLQRNRNKQ